MIVNGKYDINPELFSQLDEGGRRGHDQKLFKKRFRLDIRKLFFKIVIDNWIIGICPLSDVLTRPIALHCIKTFKKHLSSELESEAVQFKAC